MGNWYCKCGNRMSDGQSPTPHGYEVYTSKQHCDGDLDNKRPYADAYICPECGRIMIFGRDADRYMLYRPEAASDSADNEEKNGSELIVSFSDTAWSAYSGLSEKEDIESTKAVSDINNLLQDLKDSGSKEMSVRNMLVGSEHQICYRIYDSVIEVISIEWIFE